MIIRKTAICALSLMTFVLSGCNSNSSSTPSSTASNTAANGTTTDNSTTTSASNTSDIDVGVGALHCQLGSAELTSSSTVASGKLVHCFFGMSVAGNGVAKNTHVTVQLPTEFTGIKADGATINGQTVDWSLGDVTLSAHSFEITAYISTSTVNTVNVNATIISPSDNTPANNSVSTTFGVVPAPESARLFAVTSCMSSAGKDCGTYFVNVGDTVTYTTVITNRSENVTAYNVKDTFNYDQALLKPKDSRELVFGTIAPGEKKTLTHSAVVNVYNGGVIPVTTILTDDSSDPFTHPFNLKINP